MRLSITGANGFVGRRLVNSLHQQGYEIAVLCRSKNESFPNGIRVVVGDLTEGVDALADFVADCDVLMHCAGETRDPNAMQLLHLGGTRNLIDAACARSRSKPLHWVQLSSVGAYGPPLSPSEKRVVTEDTPPRPVGPYEITKTQADELVMRAAKAGTFSYSIVRPSNIFAAEMTNGSLRSLGAMIKKRIFFYVGSPGAIATYVHVDDVVETLVLCAMDARAKGKVFNISNDCRLEEMISGLANSLGVKPPRVRIPEILVRGVARIAGKILRTPLTQERISALVMRTTYPYLKLQRELGFVPRVSVPTSIGEVVSGRSVTPPK